MVCVLQRFLGEVPLAFDLDVERFWDVRHDEIDQSADAEDDVLVT